MESGGQATKVKSKRMRLAEAITSGRLYQTKMILDDNPHLNYVDDEGLSPLIRAFTIEDGKHRTRVAMVKLLLQHNADVNFKDDQGKHALNWVCAKNELRLVKLLLEKCLQDVDLTSQDSQGNTPLMHAVKNNNLEMVRLLVNAMRKFSLSVDQRNREDRTAYYEAVERGFDDCANVLANLGKASRGIKVNPFLEFLGISANAERSDAVRVRSAPLVKDCIGAGRGRSAPSVRRKPAAKKDERKRRRFSGTKLGNRLHKSRKIHSEVSQNGRAPNEYSPKSRNTVKAAGKCGSRNITQKARIDGSEYHERKTVDPEEHLVRDTSDGRRRGFDEKYAKNLPENENSGSNKQEQFLRLILDRTVSEPASRRSPSPVSAISANQVARCVSPANETQERHGCTSPAVSRPRIVSPRQITTVSELKSTSPNCYAFLELKASLDPSPNSLRNLLALRAEQQSEISSYRKGRVIPQYVPPPDEFVGDRSVDVITPVSERSSTRSEAARRISAVAKTVGLSLYFANKSRRGRTQSNS